MRPTPPPCAANTLDTGISTVPVFKKDTTDRNRTSPFAFTGNRFEFRMVGSADSIAAPNTVLNAALAEAFCNAADALEGAGDFEAACKAYIKESLTKHQRIIFNGDGYSQEWVEEAARRGLPNIKSMVDAIPALTKPDVVKLYEKFGIFTKAELESRAEIQYENYVSKDRHRGKGGHPHGRQALHPHWHQVQHHSGRLLCRCHCGWW